ncbi:MAG: hypothetical protein OER95_03920 [Acidimicrobiia bacterium]|nr:hypothetical protein [Acidimicrobiia bacterium]
MSDKTLGKVRGLNSIADPSDFKGASGRQSRRTTQPEAAESELQAAREAGPPVADGPHGQPTPPPAPGSAVLGTSQSPATPHRAAVPGIQRTRRELSVPVPIAEAVEKTGINPADVVMSAYRKHCDAVYTGSGGRLMSRGRRRLRLSISDAEFDKLTRLGQARGWNRSETVAVLLALELLPSETLAD